MKNKYDFGVFANCLGTPNLDGISNGICGTKEYFSNVLEKIHF